MVVLPDRPTLTWRQTGPCPQAYGCGRAALHWRFKLWSQSVNRWRARRQSIKERWRSRNG